MSAVQTQQELLLCRRMAWRDMQPHKPRPEDVKYTADAIRMLNYIAALNYAMLDPEEELTAAGLFRQDVKRRVNQVSEIVRGIHERSWRMLATISDNATREYNDCTDWCYRKVQGAVLLEAPERAYNIVVALCRLVEKYNKKISPCYLFHPALPIYRIPSILECIKLTDYHIDNIIDMAVDKMKDI